MKQKYILIFSLGLLSVLGFGQKTHNTEIYCGLDKDIDLSHLKKSPINTDNNPLIYEYLEEIKKVLNNNHPYRLYNTSNEIATSKIEFNQTLNRFDKLLVIDENYYKSLVESNYHKVALIWILAHEIAHHINDDFYLPDPNYSDKIKSEVLADELAGYIVGKLTNRDITVFEYFMPKILTDKRDGDKYPKLVYRILASKIGWMKSKLAESTNYNSISTTYKKEQYENGINYFSNSFNNLLCQEFINNHKYLGFGNKSLRNGKGIYFFFDKRSDLDAIYFGEWVNDKREGKGVLYDNSGLIITGNWKNDFLIDKTKKIISKNKKESIPKTIIPKDLKRQKNIKQKEAFINKMELDDIWFKVGLDFGINKNNVDVSNSSDFSKFDLGTQFDIGLGTDFFMSSNEKISTSFYLNVFKGKAFYFNNNDIVLQSFGFQPDIGLKYNIIDRFFVSGYVGYYFPVYNRVLFPNKNEYDNNFKSYIDMKGLTSKVEFNYFLFEDYDYLLYLGYGHDFSKLFKDESISGINSNGFDFISFGIKLYSNY